jgi:hypothetical protein
MTAELVYEATERQAEFHAAGEMFKLFGGAMGGGKTWALCAEVIALSCEYAGNRGYFCRDTLTSFRRTDLLVLEAMLLSTGVLAKHNQSTMQFVLKNGSVIMYGGLGDDVNAIEKLKSMELGWFAIDEASETSENFFLMLASRLRLKVPGIKYFGLMATNPDPGWLKRRFIDQKLKDHRFIPSLPKDNPKLQRGYIERLKEIFPKDWQARFLEGDWGAFEGMNCVFPFDALQRSKAIEPREGRREIGVDVARFGDDESVIALRNGNRGRLLATFSGMDLMGLTGEIVRAKREEKPKGIKVDADGLGAGVVDRLIEQNIEVEEIHGGKKADDPERFANRKAEIYWGFRDALIGGEVSLEDDLDLHAQLTSCTYRVKSTGQIEITPKDEMKKGGVKSPDRAEAMIYAFALPEPMPWVRSV